MIAGIRNGLGAFDDPMFLWISLNSCPLNLLLVRSHQAEINHRKASYPRTQQRDQGAG